MEINNEQFNRIRTGLEKLAKEDQLMIMHSAYLSGINNALHVICEVLNIPYKGIESGMENALNECKYWEDTK